MALNSSGPLSLGGSTVGQSINLELGVSATALASINSSSFRTLAGVPSGQISISNFYGKSNASFFIFSVSQTTGSIVGEVTTSDGNYVCGLDLDGGTYVWGVSPKGVLLYANFYNVRGSGITAYGTNVIFSTQVASTSNGALEINGSTGAIISYGYATGNQNAYGVTADTSGNRFISTYISTGSSSMTISAFNSSAVYQGSRVVNNLNGPVYGIAADSSNGIYAICAAFGNDDAKMAKFTYSAGTFTYQWMRAVGPSSGVATSKYSNPMAAYGSFVYPAVSYNSQEAYFCKLAQSDGTLSWGIRAFISGGSVYISNVSIDTSENVYIFGVYTNGGSRQAFLSKFNSSGTLQFTRRVYITGGDNILNGYTDTSGNMCFGVSNYTNNIFFKMPTDGTLTGTYSVGGVTVIYESNSVITFTSQSNAIVTAISPGNRTLTGGTGGVSASASGKTITTVVVP